MSHLDTFMTFLFDVYSSLHPSSIQWDLKPRSLDHVPIALSTLSRLKTLEQTVWNC